MPRERPVCFWVYLYIQDAWCTPVKVHLVLVSEHVDQLSSLLASLTNVQHSAYNLDSKGPSTSDPLIGTVWNLAHRSHQVGCQSKSWPANHPKSTSAIGVKICALVSCLFIPKEALGLADPSWSLQHSAAIIIIPFVTPVPLNTNHMLDPQQTITFWPIYGARRKDRRRRQDLSSDDHSCLNQIVSFGCWVISVCTEVRDGTVPQDTLLWRQSNKVRRDGGKKVTLGEHKEKVLDTNLCWPPTTERDKSHRWTIFPTCAPHSLSLSKINKCMDAVGNLCSLKCVNMAPTSQWPINLSLATHWAKIHHNGLHFTQRNPRQQSLPTTEKWIFRSYEADICQVQAHGPTSACWYTVCIQ